MTDTVAACLTVREAAETRRSIRRYTPEQLPREDLEELLATVALAPSAYNVQPWRFVVVQDPSLKARLADAAYGQRQVHSAPTVLVMYSDMRDALENVEELVHPGIPADRRPAAIDGLRAAFADRTPEELEQWGAAQSYIALGYLVLAARAMGYDTSAMLGFDAAKVKALLGIPAHAAVPAIVAIGIGDEEGFPHHRHPVDRIATFR